jgi:PTS system nitrogen regulatory IIA component
MQMSPLENDSDVFAAIDDENVMSEICIAELMPARRLISWLRGRNKHHVLRALAKCLARDAAVSEQAIARVVETCAQYPVFGLDTGVALFHATLPGLELPIAAAARLDTALDFGALDGQPTDIVVLLLSPPSPVDLHLRALACLARRLRREDVRQHLRGADGPDAMHVILAGDETVTRKAVREPRQPTGMPATVGQP